MKKTWLMALGIFTGFMAILFSTVVAFAQTAAPPETIEGLLIHLGKAIEAIAAGDWPVIGGFVVMVLAVVLRQYLLPIWKITSDWLPAVIAGITAIATLGLSMFNKVEWQTAVLSGIEMALFAGGAWSLLGKKLFEKLYGLLGKELEKPVKTD